MKTNIILYNTEKNKNQFLLSSGIKPYGILLAISKGSFRLTFPTLNKTYTLSPYEIAYMPPNIEFYREVITPIDFYQFTFQIYDDDKNTLSLNYGKIDIPKVQIHSIIESAEMIPHHSQNTDIIVNHLLNRIFTDYYLFSQSKKTSSISREILLVTNYISNNLNQDLSICKLASQVHLSANGLIWKFKKELNTTPLKYIAMCRTNYAKHLLLNGNMTIKNIAEVCGYTNEYYFSNSFKKNVGISPSGFRKNKTYNL